MRKLKSHVFQNGAAMTVGEMHASGVMTYDTKNIRFVNHHLKDDIAKHRTGTKTQGIQRKNLDDRDTLFRRCRTRAHQYILLNAAGASAGDAVLSIDSDPPRTESHQYKKVQTDNAVDIKRERAKTDSRCQWHFLSLLHQQSRAAPNWVATGERCC